MHLTFLLVPIKELIYFDTSDTSIRPPQLASFEAQQFVSQIKCNYEIVVEAHGGAVDWGTVLQVGRSRVRSPKMSSFLPHYGPGVFSASNIFCVVKAAGACCRQPSCVDCTEIWEPQPPGTLRACPGM